MDEHMHISMLFTISFFFFLTTVPQFSHCQQPLPHGYNYSVCKEESYNCGELSNISYPFWGQNRPSYCGGGDLFKLSCNDQNGPNTTTALINSQNFTVLEINPADYTFRIVRTDLIHDICSPQFNDIYLSPTLFKASVYNITISYNCSSVDFPFSGNNYFTCGDENVIYRVDSEEITSNPINLPECGRHVQVLADAPLNNASGGVDALKQVLEKGFEVNYIVAPECVSCLGSEGICLTIDFQKNVSSCYYCPDGSHALHCSALINTHHKSTKFNWERKAIIGVSAAVAGLLLMCIIFCCCGRKSSTWQEKFCLTTKSDIDVEAFLKNHGVLAQKRYKFSEVKKMTNSFKVQLGQGGFGVVYKGKLLGTGCPIAVKILNASKGNGEEFINEVASISRTSHVNIVTLLGFCLEGRKKALIYEFMPNGSLDKFIYKMGPETIESLSWENLYQIAIGIARGLEYLHRGCNTRILHFDIKPHNILLDENLCPKISDFGLAKLCHKKESIISMSDARGTMGYVAPEVWNRHFGGVSHKSDVYSYGMMLLEMVGGRKNINAEASHTSEIYFPHWVYNRLELGSDLRPNEVMAKEENDIARRMTVVGLWCIQTLPNDRPTISKVIDMLEGSMNSLEMPPKPLHSSPTRSVPESST